MRCAFSRSIRFAPGWPRLLKRGRGCACVRVLRGATTRGSRSARRLSERRDSPISWNLSLDEQAALDGFETLSPNGRPLGAEDFIAMVETKLGRKVRPAKRGESPTEGGWIDMGNS